MKTSKALIWSGLFSLVGSIAHAGFNSEYLQVSNCLAHQLPANYEKMAHNQTYTVVKVPTVDLRKMHNLADKARCGAFVNISNRFTDKPSKLHKATAVELLKKPFSARLILDSDYTISHSKQVQQALKLVRPENLTQTLTDLSSFTNRSSTQRHGVKVASWLKTRFEAMAVEFGRKDTKSYFVATGGVTSSLL